MGGADLQAASRRSTMARPASSASTIEGQVVYTSTARSIDLSVVSLKVRVFERSGRL